MANCGKLFTQSFEAGATIHPSIKIAVNLSGLLFQHLERIAVFSNDNVKTGIKIAERVEIAPRLGTATAEGWN
jgi:hypothetical protein